MRRSWMIIGVLATLASVAQGQSWREAYDNGLKSIKTSAFADARKHFKQSAAYRPEDQSGPTMLPGPVSEQRKWRDGAPYSPNFLAAYASYKQGMVATGEERNNLFNEAAAEFEGLVAKKQYSYETFYFLTTIYNALNRTEKRLALEQAYAALNNKVEWKVDSDGITPEELAIINQSYRGTPTAAGDNSGTIVSAPSTTAGGNTAPVASAAGRVPMLGNKYALIIGNSTSQIGGAGIPFAADDAQMLREALLTHMGYGEGNVDLVINATAPQILASAKALADRMPQDATLVIFYAGVGVNLGGKDFLAGVDTASATDSSSMLAKGDLYKPFMAKGASIFAFFQANRPIVDGRYFGMEVPMFGAISQTQATLPGQSVFSIVRGGKSVGIFTDAMASVAADLRSNRLPIMEYGWQVFYKMRRGATGTEGGSGSQTPTLPVLTNMSSDARF